MDDTQNENKYVFDPESSTEMARLISLDRFTTQAMGGPLPEQIHADALRDVLDIACGPGGWVLDMAFAYPNTQVAGVDISRTMIDYASARARTQKIANASFGIMDITQPLDFADNTFDLVNGRFLIGLLSRAAWTSLLSECKRILRPGGVLRLTEADTLGLTTSQAFERLRALSARLYAQIPDGRSFSPDGSTYGITPVLPWLLRSAGYQQVRTNAHVLEFSTDMPAWADFYHNTEIIYIQLHDTLIQMGLATQEELEELHQNIHIQMCQDDFCGIWHYVTAYGYKP